MKKSTTTRRNAWLSGLFVAALLGLPLAGCDVDEGPFEELGEEVDDAADEIGDEVEDATDGG
jgi:hypothetical protein